MPGPSRYNRKLKAKNDRKRARASRGGRTPSEAALGRSMAAAGNRVSRSNRRATAPPSTRTFKSERKPVRARRTRPRPGGLEGTINNLLSEAEDRVDDAERLVSGGAKAVAKVATTPIAPTTANLSLGERAELSTFAIPGVGVASKASKVPKVVGAAKKVLGIGSKKKPKPILPKPPKARPKPKPKKRKGRQKPEPSKPRKVAKRVGKTVANTPKRNPIITAGAAAVAADEAGVGGEVTRRAANTTRGVVDSLNPMNAEGKFDPFWFGPDSKDSPLGRTTGTTFRAIPGAIAGLGKGVGAVANTGYRGIRRGAYEAGELTGSPLLENVGADYTGEEIADPVANTAKETAEGLKEMAKPFVEGDREGVKRAMETQIGLAPAVLTPRFLRATRRSKPYQEGRGVLRDAASDRRNRRRREKVEERRRQSEADETVTTPAPKGATRDSRSRREDEYVFQGLGRKIESRRIRKEQARRWDRMSRADQREAMYMTRDLIRSLSKARKMGGRKRSKAFAADLAAVLQVVAQQSLSRNPARARYELERLLTQIEKPGEGTPNLTGRVGDRQAIRALLDNPEIFESDVFWNTVDRFKGFTRAGTERSKGEGGGQRARYEAPANRMGIPLPETVVVERGIRVPGKGVVKDDISPDQDARLTADATKLRAEARELDTRARELDPADPRAVELIRQSAAKTKEATEKIRRRDAAREARQIAEKDFVNKTRSALLLRGQDPEPGYVRDAARPEIGQDNASLVTKAGIPVPKDVRAEQRRTGELRRSGLADRAVDTMTSQTLLRPRLITSINQYTRDTIKKYHLKIRGKNGRPSMVNTSEEIAAAVTRGEVPPGFVAVHNQFWRAAVRSKDAEFDDQRLEALYDDGLNPIVGADDLKLAEKGGQLKSGHKYILVNRAAWEERTGQLRGLDNDILRFAARTNRIASTGILGYNPSWALAQQFAEGLPAALAIGVSPGAWDYVLRAERAYQNMTPDQRAVIDAVSGSAGGTLRSTGNLGRGGMPDQDLVRMPAWVRETPVYQKLKRRGANEQDIQDFNLGFNERGWAAMKDLAKGRGLNEIVLYTGGIYRRGVMNAEIYRRRRKAILGLAKASTAMRDIDKKLSKMDAKDAQLYLARNPKQAERLADYMEDVMGNWTSLTTREAAIAPFTAFYPYLRYSLRWTFYGFPVRHPVKASILYFLAQQNANELEEFLGGKPESWLEYAFPVVTLDEGEKVRLKGASRFQPALSAIVEAIGTDKFERLLGVANPFLATALEAPLGFDSFRGETSAYGALDRALLGLAGLASMLAPIRWGDNMVPPGVFGTGWPGGTTSAITPQKDYAKPRKSDVPLLDGVPLRSGASKAFRKADPNAYAKNFLELISSRSSFNVLAPQNQRNARRERRLARAFNRGRYEVFSEGRDSSSGSGWFGSSGDTREKEASGWFAPPGSEKKEASGWFAD